MWMADEPLLRGRTYLMRVGHEDGRGDGRADQVQARRRHARRASPPTHLELNEIGVVNLELERADRLRPVRREPRHGRLHPHRPDHEPHRRRRPAPLRAAPLAQRPAGRRSTSTARRAPRRRASSRSSSGSPACPGAGKSTIANAARAAAARARPPHLHARRRQPAPRPVQGSRLHRRRPRGEQPPRRRGGEDDDRRRADRHRGVRLPVPRRARDGARAVRRGEFLEVFVDVPPEVAAERDTKGLYAKAREGGLENLTGIGSTYEPPESPEVHLDMASLGDRGGGGQDRRRARGARAADLKPHHRIKTCYDRGWSARKVRLRR